MMLSRLCAYLATTRYRGALLLLLSRAVVG